MSDYWMVTWSGERFDILEPEPEMVHLIDIATHLARINRWTGATLQPYSVAQHSVEVSRLCPTVPLAGLLHDAHEAYIGDASKPLKKALESLGAGDALKEIERRIDAAVAKRFGLDPATFGSQEVKQADLILLATEKRDLVREHVHEWTLQLPEPMPRAIIPGNFIRAEREFLARFDDLSPNPNSGPAAKGIAHETITSSPSR